MLYKNCYFIFIVLFLTNCTSGNYQVSKKTFTFKDTFSNKGFALIYNKSLFEKKIVTKKIDERELIIFQKNLKKGTQVKISNILNGKSLLAIVGSNAEYPSFNNSVVSIRIAEDLELKENEPYIEITAISKNSLFVAKKAKTFDEEKSVANKVPVTNISIKDLNKKKSKKKIIYNENFLYSIKISDFFFENTASLMIKRIIEETKVRNPKVKKISNEKYRVFLGPFDNINSLQKSFNDINILEFENIEIIKND